MTTKGKHWKRSKEANNKVSAANKGKTAWNKGLKNVNGKQKGVAHKKGYHWKMSEEGKKNIKQASLKRDNTKWMELGWKITHNSTFIPNYKGGSDVSAARRNKRRRGYGFIPLNNWFFGCAGHHFDKNFVIYIPKKIHRSIYHSVNKNINMDKINDLAIDFIFNETIIRNLEVK